MSKRRQTIGRLTGTVQDEWYKYCWSGDLKHISRRRVALAFPKHLNPDSNLFSHLWQLYIHPGLQRLRVNFNHAAPTHWLVPNFAKPRRTHLRHHVHITLLESFDLLHQIVHLQRAVGRVNIYILGASHQSVLLLYIKHAKYYCKALVCSTEQHILIIRVCFFFS